MKAPDTRFELRMSKDGRHIIFKATRPNEAPVSMTFTPEDAGKIVVGLLGTIIACAQRTKSTAQPFSEGNMQQQLAFVQANGVALQDVTDTPDVIALCFQFGQTQVGIGLPRAALRPLGTALLAASADPSRPQ